VSVLTTGCGLTVPTDPNGTLDTVSGGTMRVGVSPDPGLVEVDAGHPYGPLVDITEDFADTLDTRIEWTVASEETLVSDLEAGDIELAIGGFSDGTPWTDRAGITRGYKNIEGADGRSLVFLVPLGENAFLSRLEIFLDEEVGS
jgi:membrane-bound lytic murein transglycosylase MltF